jgi:CubicO group peptidase (beta-lactamase class C family)
MMTPALERYGFGWRIDQFEGHTRYHHSGSTSGFRNFIAHFPDLDLTLIILTNRAGPDVLPIGEEILRLYFEQVSI